jgi:hypothetical protein
MLVGRAHRWILLPFILHTCKAFIHERNPHQAQTSCASGTQRSQLLERCRHSFYSRAPLARSISPETQQQRFISLHLSLAHRSYCGCRCASHWDTTLTLTASEPWTSWAAAPSLKGPLPSKLLFAPLWANTSAASGCVWCHWTTGGESYSRVVATHSPM